jgi:hypothetical protein
MLPFLDKKKTVSAVIARRGKPALEVKSEIMAPESGGNPALESAAEDILRAIEEKSVLGLAQALKAAYEICESEPGDEGAQEGGA